jgi:putative endonuclease
MPFPKKQVGLHVGDNTNNAAVVNGTNSARESVRFFVYVIVSRDIRGHRTYVGWALDPDRRLAEHNSGRGARSTRGRTWTLLHVEALASKREAMSREWHLKRDRAFRKRLAQAWLAQAG